MIRTHAVVGLGLCLWMLGGGVTPVWAQEEEEAAAAKAEAAEAAAPMGQLEKQQLEKQCAAKDGDACGRLGFSLLSPDGDTRVNARAIQYLRRSCGLNSANGCALLGVCHLNGVGVPKDLRQAETLLTKACAAGSKLGCSQQENLCEASGREDCAREQELRESRAGAEQACSKGGYNTCVYLGDMYREGESVKRDPQRARELYTKACEGGDASGCQQLGDVLLEGGKPNKAQALQAFLKACDKGNAPACAKGARLLEGRGMPKDALARYAKACEQGDNASCLAGAPLAEKYYKEAGQDPTMSLRLYRLACSRGEHEACGALTARGHSQYAARLLRQLEGNRSVTALAFSPRGGVLAVAYQGGYLQFWDPETGRALTEPQHEHSQDILQLAFSEDGAWLASVSQGTGVRLWDMASKEVRGVPLRDFEASPSRFVAFLPGQQGLLSDMSLSEESWLRVWNPTTRKATVPELLKLKAKPHAAMLAPTRQMLFLALGWRGGEGVQRVDLQARAALGPPMKPKLCSLESLAVSPEGTWLATGCESGGLFQLWDATTGQLRGEPLQHGYYAVEALAFDPSGSLLVSAAGSSLRLWDVASGAPMSGDIGGEKGKEALSLQRVAFSPDGRVLAAGRNDGHVLLFALEPAR